MRKNIKILISLTFLILLTLFLSSLPQGIPFNENNDIARLVVFDTSGHRRAHSFTLNINNVLKVESGLRRVNIMRYIRTLGADPSVRLRLVRQGIFLENSRNITEITVSQEEVREIILLLNNLYHIYPLQISPSQDARAGDGGWRWGTLLYFDGRYYEAIISDNLPYMESLRDIVDKIIGLSDIRINLPARN